MSREIDFQPRGSSTLVYDLLTNFDLMMMVIITYRRCNSPFIGTDASQLSGTNRVNCETKGAVKLDTERGSFEVIIRTPESPLGCTHSSQFLPRPISSQEEGEFRILSCISGGDELICAFYGRLRGMNDGLTDWKGRKQSWSWSWSSQTMALGAKR